MAARPHAINISVPDYLPARLADQNPDLPFTHRGDVFDYQVVTSAMPDRAAPSKTKPVTVEEKNMKIDYIYITDRKK